MTRAVFEGHDAAPGAFEQHLSEGGALLSAGRLDEALGHLEAAHSLQPKDDKAQNLLGLCCFKLGHLDRAAEIYELLVRDNPVDATLRVNLGLVYLKANALQRAVREFETATDLAPDHRKAHNYLGLALAQAGEYGRAREHFVLAGSDHMAERMARALDGGGFESGSTPAGGTLVVRARPSQVPAPADVGPASALDSGSAAAGAEDTWSSGTALPHPEEDSQVAASSDAGANGDASASGSDDANFEGAADSQDEAPEPEVVGGESWDDDWNLETVSTAPDGGRVASLRPARLEDSWGAQFGLEGEAPESGEAAEELVVELHAEDEEPVTSEPKPAYGVADTSFADPVGGEVPAEPGVDDGWIDGGEGGWDDGASDPEISTSPTWSGEDAPHADGTTDWAGQAAYENGAAASVPDWSGEQSAMPAPVDSPAWSGEQSALAASVDAPAWSGEQSALAASVDSPTWSGEQSALDDASEAAASESWSGAAAPIDAVVAGHAGPSEAFWSDPSDVGPEAAQEDNWSAFEPEVHEAHAPAPAPESTMDASGGFQAAEPDHPTLVPAHASAPEPEWARAHTHGGGQAVGAWLAELARGLVLGEPLSGDESFSVAPDGVTAIRLRDGLRTRTAGFLALEGEVDLTPEPRRKHGRATGKPFGTPGREVLRVRGHGLLHVRVPGKRLVPLELGEEGVYLREPVAYAFEESVMFENGSLSDADGQEVGVVHLRGAGRILLELEGELRTVTVREGAPVSVELLRLVGWLGEVAPQLRSAVTGLGDRVELKGSGFALLDAASRGTSS